MVDWLEDDRRAFRSHFSDREAPDRNSGRSTSRGPSGPGSYTPSPSTHDQRAVVRASIKDADSASRHLDYIEREGAGADGEEPTLFTDDGEELDRDTFEDRIDEDEPQFAVVVSPEKGDELDMKEYVREWADRVEEDLDRDLDWAAAVHEDTDNPHAHVVIRGRDRSGEAVRMDPNYLNHGMRHRAREAATHQLGPRTTGELAYQYQRETTAARPTEIDQIVKHASQSNDSKTPDGPDKTPSQRATAARDIHPDEGFSLDDVDTTGRPGLQREHLKERLEYLEDHGLASRNETALDESRGRDRWYVDPNVESELRELHNYVQTAQKMERAGYHEPAEWTQYPPDRPTAGRVTHVERGDGDDTAHYSTVETPDGKARLVERPGADLESGDIVQLQRDDQRPAVDPVEPNSFREAIEADGPTWLDRELHEQTSPSGDNEWGSELREALADRQRVLRERGLVREDGRPPRDLVKKLRHYEQRRYAESLASQTNREVADLETEGDRISGQLSDRVELDGSNVHVVENDDEVAVVTSNRHLERHENEEVTIELQREDGRTRPRVRGALKAERESGLER